MHFEKWQALGNDYVIVEERELPFELTPGRVRAICAPHTGIGSDGVLLIRKTDEAEFVAEVKIYNPDGSEAELSGNGVRQAVMYLRRKGWTARGQLLGAHSRRRDSARISRATSARWTSARCACARRPISQAGEMTAPARSSPALVSSTSSSSRWGTRRWPIEVKDGLEELVLDRYGPVHRAERTVPEPHERVVLAAHRRRRDPRADLRARGGGDHVVGYGRHGRGRGCHSARRRRAR